MGWTRRTWRHLRLSRFCFVPPMGLLRSFPGCRGRLPRNALRVPARVRPARAGSVALERDVEHIADVIREDEVEALPLLLRDLLHVTLVAVRDDHLLDPG